MDNIVIAVVDDASCGMSPVMPYVGTRFCGKDFTELTKLNLSAALLRCGFDVFDRTCSNAADMQELMMRVNRNDIDAVVMVSCNAFGSRKTFNDRHGFAVRSSSGRFGQKSKILCEDICAKLELSERSGDVYSDGYFGAANCPTAIAEIGYLTYFDEAKLMQDPDFSVSTAEYIAMGICEYFDMPYVKRDDIFAYPMLCTARRGKKVKMLQHLMNLYGFELNTDGVFGSETDNAVKKLCENNGKPFGAVTAAVWRDLLLTNIPDRLDFGSRDVFVWYLQRKLYAKLYSTPIDGVLGDETLSALNEYLSETANDSKLTCADGVSGEIIKLLSPVGGGRPRLF